MTNILTNFPDNLDNFKRRTPYTELVKADDVNELQESIENLERRVGTKTDTVSAAYSDLSIEYRLSKISDPYGNVNPQAYIYQEAGTLLAGDILALDNATFRGVVRNTIADNPFIVGVARDGTTAGIGTTVYVIVQNANSTTPVYINCVTDATPIAIGDYITASSTTGKATRGDITSKGILGIALTSLAAYSSNAVAVYLQSRSANMDAGTTNQTFTIQEEATTPVKIKNVNGTLQIRNNADTNYANLICQDLNVKGTQTVVESIVVKMVDPIITLNASASSGDPRQYNSGIEIARGNYPSSQLVWNESASAWQAGISSGDLLDLVRDVTTTKGDIIVNNGTELVKLPASTNTFVLVCDDSTETGLVWEPNPGGFPDPMTSPGDIIIRDASNTTTVLHVGASGQVLRSDGYNIHWSPADDIYNFYIKYPYVDATGTIQEQLIAYNGLITSMTAVLGASAAVGSAFIVDVLNNGASGTWDVVKNSGDTYTFPTVSTVLTTKTNSNQNTTVTVGKALGIRIRQVGSSVVGQDLKIQVTVLRT